MGFLDKLFGPPRPDRFAQQLMTALKKAGEARDIAYDAETFTLQFRGPSGKDEGTAYLNNFFAEYSKLPRGQRKACLQHIVRGLLSQYKEMPEEFEDVCPDLRPIIRSRTYLEFASMQMEMHNEKEVIIPHQLIGDHLIATVVYDLPEAMRSLNQENLDGWGRTFYEVMEAARDNLEQIEFAFASIGDCLYASASGDNYDASRLLLLDVIGNFEVKGALIAMVVNRDKLFLTGEEDEEGLELMATLAVKALDGPRPISGVAVRLEGDEWVTWMPAPDHTHYDKFRLLELKSLAGEYAEQKALLETWHEKECNTDFVATYSVAEKDGKLFSYTVWPRGKRTLLPRAELVVFFDPEREVVATSTWERVCAVVGALLEPHDRYPPRWLVKDFPSEEELESMHVDGLLSKKTEG